MIWICFTLKLKSYEPVIEPRLPSSSQDRAGEFGRPIAGGDSIPCSSGGSGDHVLARYGRLWNGLVLALKGRLGSPQLSGATVVVRKMRWIAIAAVSVLVPLALATSAYAGQARLGSATCVPRHAHVVVSDAQADVYSVRRRDGESVVRACAVGHRSSYRLEALRSENACGPQSCGGAIKNEVLAGAVVAYEAFSTSEGDTGGENVSEEWLVVVRDLATRRVLHRFSTGVTNPPNPRLVGNGFTVAIVVKRDGAVAWINWSGIQPPVYQVHAVDESGSRLLAESAEIEPLSLALAGNSLYWTQGGKAELASLD